MSFHVNLINFNTRKYLFNTVLNKVMKTAVQILNISFRETKHFIIKTVVIILLIIIQYFACYTIY